MPQLDWRHHILTTGGLLSPKECGVLADYAARAPRDGVALEVGHYTGLSTLVLLNSLPYDMPLVTVDNHEWRAVPRDLFEANVKPYVGNRPFEIRYEDFRYAVSFADTYSFVFYDAGHDLVEIKAFMERINFAADAMLLFDDADWPVQNEMTAMALEQGFIDVTPLSFYRYALPYTTGNEQCDLDIGKRHPDTYTLRVMRRTVPVPGW